MEKGFIPDSKLSYLTTAFDMIPILVSGGGIEECPPDVWTLNSTVR